jgi:prophage regulatory protein
VKLINKKILLSMVPLSERTIYTLEKKGQFPSRFALSARSVVWDLGEVLAWMEKRKQEAIQADRPGPDAIHKSRESAIKVRA